jgi:hypothetical protein
LRNFLFALLLCFAPVLASSQSQPRLKVVSVSAPAINCVFSTTCTITVNDATDSIPMSAGGTGVLKSRTFKGLPGSPADGLFAFEYLLDLRNAVGATAISCIDSMTINFSPVVSSLDFNSDRKPDQVFVVTGGGIGTIGLAAAVPTSNLKFIFASPICSGAPGKGGAPDKKGDSSFFWGLVSMHPPKIADAALHEPGGAIHHVKVRVPQ